MRGMQRGDEVTYEGTRWRLVDHSAYRGTIRRADDGAELDDVDLCELEPAQTYRPHADHPDTPASPDP